MKAFKVKNGKITLEERGEGLLGLYALTECSMIEVASSGVLNGVPVALICDEEGLYKEEVEVNMPACDLRAEMTNSGPHYSIVGTCSLVSDDDLRGFSEIEIVQILIALGHGGYPYEG